jgi:predicted nucleotidyltransferase component of viral defense system
MNYEILDEKRKKELPKFKAWKDAYVLAGGTALALQIGHRDSVDFDFFTEEEIDTVKFYEKLREIFSGQKIEKIQEEKNTLSVLIDGEIRLSFLKYPYQLLKQPLEDKNLRVASLEDIGCMKLSAITGRASNKDYIDLYYILKKFSLDELLKLAKEKFSNLNLNLVLKSLVYFEDVLDEPIRFQKGKEVSMDEVRKFLEKQVKGFKKSQVVKE